MHLWSQPTSPTQANDLLAQVLKAYLVNARLNFAYSGYPFHQTINVTLAASDSLAAVGAAIAINNAASAVKCLDWVPAYAAGGPFMRLRCNHIPYPNSWSGTDSIWGPNLPDYTQEHLLDSNCQASFGIKSVNGGEALRRQLGLDQQTLENSTRLLVVEDLVDPTTALGADSWNPVTSRNHSRIMYIGQSSHTELFAMICFHENCR